METNELRIGNIIYNTRGKADKVNIDALKYLQQYPNTLCQVKPIPLTEQWLKDFGFEGSVNENSKCRTYSIGKFKIWIQNGSFCFHHYSYFEIKHVHQLQNLYFALTDEELTLKSK
jgi:hypothetical protein